MGINIGHSGYYVLKKFYGWDEDIIVKRLILIMMLEIPELHDINLSAFRKHKGIRIKFKELGYESILISGMAANITRQHKNRLRRKF